jgi:hypothetical protein
MKWRDLRGDGPRFGIDREEVRDGYRRIHFLLGRASREANYMPKPRRAADATKRRG